VRHTLTTIAPTLGGGALPLAAVQLESVLDGVHDGVILRAGDRVTLNAAARRILAAPDGIEFRVALVNPRTLDGEPFALGANDLPGQDAIDNGTGGRFRIRVTAFDGRELVLDGSVSPAGAGAVIVFRDVTDEHERSELNVRTLNALFAALPIAVSVADAETREIRVANPAFAKLVDRSIESMVGLRPPFPWWLESETGEDRFTPGTRTECVFVRPDGRPRSVEVRVQEVRDERGEAALLLAVITDLSEGRRMQQQLVQSGKLAAIGELAAGVAHEINNPLFAILGLTEFLLKEAEPGSRAHQRLELIQTTGLEIKEIVRALLDFARENAEERHEVHVTDVVRDTINLIRRTNAHKGVELVETYCDGDAVVYGSPNQLKQILLNLVANARQAMPHGGTVRVDVHCHDDSVMVTVSDEGPGIPVDVAPRIFAPFFTTKRATGGTGLGLSVSLGIAEAHGGTLTVASEHGDGAAFTLCLPTAGDDG
jgi:PAS domain S-box-containing protein